MSTSVLVPPIDSRRPMAVGHRVALSPAAIWGTCLIVLSVCVWAAGFVVGFPVALSVLTLTGFAAAIVGLRWPVLGLLGVSMLCTLDPITRNLLLVGGLLRFNTFNYWLLVVILLGSPLLLRLKDPQTRIMQAFLAVLGLGLLITPDLYRGVLHVLSVFTMLGLLVYFIRAIDNKEAWLWLGLVNGVLAGVGGLVFYLQRNALGYVNPNSVNKFPLTAIICICLAAHFVGGRSRPLIVLGLLAAVNFVWVFLTGSRGGLLIATFCAAYLLLEVRGFSRRFAIAAAAGVVAIAIVVQFTELQEKTIHRVEKLFDANYSLASRTSGRSDLALAGFYMFLEHPFGVGTGGFAETWEGFDRREELSARFYQTEKQAHSAWIKTVAENGIPGILLLVAYVASFTLSGWRQRHDGMLRLGMLVTGVFAVAFISTEFQGKLFWLLAAGVTALLHYRHHGEAHRHD
jgi:O-antigen ligase